MTIEPDTITKDTIKTESDLPFKTIYVDDDTLEKDVEVVETEGVTGKKTTVVVITYTNGVETDRDETEVIIDPVDKVILRGTKIMPVITTDTIEVDSDLAFEVIYEDDPTLELGKEKVKVEGVVGTETETIKITYTDGVETSRERISTVVTLEPIDKVILKGTKVTPVEPEKPVTAEEDHKELGAVKPEEDNKVLGAEKPKETSKLPATSISNDAILFGTTFMTALSGLYITSRKRRK